MTGEKTFLGCGDNSCIFERPAVGTNGGCRCFNDIDDRAVRHRVRQAAQQQRQQIVALTSERDEAVRIARDLLDEAGLCEQDESGRKYCVAHFSRWPCAVGVARAELASLTTDKAAPAAGKDQS